MAWGHNTHSCARVTIFAAPSTAKCRGISEAQRVQKAAFSRGLYSQQNTMSNRRSETLAKPMVREIQNAIPRYFLARLDCVFYRDSGEIHVNVPGICGCSRRPNVPDYHRRLYCRLHLLQATIRRQVCT